MSVESPSHQSGCIAVIKGLCPVAFSFSVYPVAPVGYQDEANSSDSVLSWFYSGTYLVGSCWPPSHITVAPVRVYPRV